MTKPDLYRELFPTYSARFERRNLDFDKHFDLAYSNLEYRAGPDVKAMIIGDLERILRAYVSSKPKSDAGGFFRKAGKVLVYILPFLKYVKFKK